MLQPPPIIYFATAAQLLPLAGGLAARKHADSARVWIMFWGAFYFIGDMSARYLGIHHQNNHFLSYFGTPIQGAAILWALSLWQRQPVARLTMRLAIPVFWIAWVLLVVLVEDVDSFSTVAEPVYSLLGVGAATFTLLTRSNHESEPLLRQDWFWICSGLTIHFGVLAALTPLAAAYVYKDPGLVIQAYVIRAWINIFSFILITIGMACPRPTQPGLFFSPRSSV